jgi:hypothetical protein
MHPEQQQQYIQSEHFVEHVVLARGRKREGRGGRGRELTDDNNSCGGAHRRRRQGWRSRRLLHLDATAAPPRGGPSSP